jgi:hypothetical protein
MLRKPKAYGQCAEDAYAPICLRHDQDAGSRLTLGPIHCARAVSRTSASLAPPGSSADVMRGSQTGMSIDRFPTTVPLLLHGRKYSKTPTIVKRDLV